MDPNRRRFMRFTSLAVGGSLLGTPRWSAERSFDDRHRSLAGIVCSGSGEAKRPLSGVPVVLFEATSRAPQILGVATTDEWGHFRIKISHSRYGARSVLYVTAHLKKGLELVTVMGRSLPEFVTINELTTVAAGYAMAQFTVDGVLSGERLGLRIAAEMNDNLVHPASGGSSSVVTSSPNGDQTNSWRSTLSLANLVAWFVVPGGPDVDELFRLSTPPGGKPPRNVLQALSNIARYPQQNVMELYDLTRQVTVFAPTLSNPPDAWTIVVKVNDTGDDRFLFGGPGNIAFDRDGYAWITNNVVQGTRHSSRFAVVLRPDGRPATGRDDGPRSPLFGGGLLGGGFGVSVAPNDRVWLGNFGWGSPQYYPSPGGNGSVSEFSTSGRAISGRKGYQGGPVRAQAVVPDARGNIWIASYGNDRVYVFLGGDPGRSVFFQQPAGSKPFAIQIARDGTAWVSNSGGLRPRGQGSVARYVLAGDRLRQLFFREVGHSNRGLALDSRGRAWLASAGDDYVYWLNQGGKVLDKFNGGGTDTPWGISVDGDDNIWIGNFGPEEVDSDFTTAALTKLAGENPRTRPPGLRTGDPISPPSGYTLPSEGRQVRMHNGEPLYGYGGPKCFSPLMRVTAVTIDRAGNIWVANNFKPNFKFDLINPGGDGICIFVGAAKPPLPAWSAKWALDV